MIKSLTDKALENALSIPFFQKNFVRALGYGRLGLFSLEALPIIHTRKALGVVSAPSQPIPSDHLEILHQTIGKMIEEDRLNIESGLYPVELLKPENPLSHARRYIKIFTDNIRAAQKVKAKKNREFSSKIKSHLVDLPNYYTRNFHNQTDGYLSDESAELYAHQIEILFKGSMGLMRRLLLADLIKYINTQNRPLRVLELGCGSGDTTQILLKTCKNIEVTGIDLSRPYLAKAKKQNQNATNVEWVFSPAESYQASEPFDVVLSSYLFHEVPLVVRRQIYANIAPFVKAGGVWISIDSIQKNDNPDMEWALEQFPKDFHEPYYKTYVENSLEEDLPPGGFKHVSTKQAFLSKCVWLEKV